MSDHACWWGVHQRAIFYIAPVGKCTYSSEASMDRRGACKYGPDHDRAEPHVIGWLCWRSSLRKDDNR